MSEQTTVDAPAPGFDRQAETLEVVGASKRFGTTQAVADATLSVRRGELVGIAGHNGAGKSTLLNVVTGRVRADAGTVVIRGIARDATQRMPDANTLGIRVVHQELSLAPTLRIDEVAGVYDHSVGGVTWRRTAWRRLAAVLDEMFPDHGLRAGHVVQDLSLSRRQMIECACAVLPGREPPSLLILDEPTSALDSAATASFYAYLRPRADAGLSAIVTTHRLQEMVDHLNRIYIMRDARVLGQQTAQEASRESLVRAMGAATHQATRAAHRAPSATARDEGAVTGVVRAEISERREDHVGTALEVALGAGELVGLAGLEGHGQLELLEALSRSAGSPRHAVKHTRHQRVRLTGTAAYVSGDRGVRGILRYWSVAANVSLSSLRRVARRGLISPGAESRMVAEWHDRLGIKGTPGDPIVSLSGGTQQKVLMARALATGSDVLLLEDPTRGVDQATKEEFYVLLRDLASEGKCIIWYSTENEELRRCDRVLVFRGGRIAGVLLGAEATEEEIISRSFAERH